MKCNCNHNILGITIASIFIMGSAMALVEGCVSYVECKSGDDATLEKSLKQEGIRNIVNSALVLVVSCLFLVAIIKRIHYLVLPWLLLQIFIFGGSWCLLLIIAIGAGFIVTSEMVVVLLVTVFLLLTLEAGIIWLSYSLFNKIRKERVENSQYQMCEKTLV